MDDKSYTVHVPKRWTRLGLIVGVTALIVGPLTALASHSFDDVPNDNTFHEDIAWLQASGVTKGCNPPDNDLFCPDDEVTREQMSAFMRRLAQYMGAEDGTPAQADNATNADNAMTADNATHADDAARFAGQDPSYYERPLVMRTGSRADKTEMPDQNGEVARVAVSSPSQGSVIVEHTSSWNNLFSSGAYDMAVWIEPFSQSAICDNQDDGDAIAGTLAGEHVDADVSFASVSGAGHVAVGQGLSRYSLCVATLSGTSHNYDWSLQASWYPSGAADTASLSSRGTTPANAGPFAP